jgi:hypothetical protein
VTNPVPANASIDAAYAWHGKIVPSPSVHADDIHPSAGQRQKHRHIIIALISHHFPRRDA